VSNSYRLDNILEFEEWMRNRGLNDSSIYQYMRAVQKFLLQKNPDIKDIEPYNEFILEFAIKKRSLYYYDALKLFLKFVFKEDVAKKNSMTRLLLKPNKNNDIKRVRKNLDDETKEQVIRLIKDYKHRIIAKIQNVLGVRAGDIIRLKRGSISYEPYNDVIAIIPGGFKPPQIAHFHIVDEISKKPEITKVKVIIGPKERDGIDKHQSLEVWNIYKKYLNNKVEFQLSETGSPIKDTINFIKDNPNNFYVLVFGRDEDKSRFKSVEKFGNVKIINIRLHFIMRCSASCDYYNIETTVSLG